MKKLTPTTVVLVLLSAGVGALATVLLSGDGAPAPVAAERPKAEAPRAQVPEVPGAVERALRKRIRQLEDELAAARAAAPTNAPARPEIHQLPKEGEARPRSPREWLENLKKNDPKKYEEHQKWMSRMRERHLKRTQSRLEFLDSIDASGMSKEERANHEKLQELLAQREELPEFNEKMTDEEMREAGRQRMQLDQEIRKASQSERTALLKQTASALGLSGEDATALTETLQDVIRATESDHHGPHGPPPPGGNR